MRRLKMLWHIIQVTGFTRFTLSFVTFAFGSGGVLFLAEPAITNYGDGLWYVLGLANDCRIWISSCDL